MGPNLIALAIPVFFLAMGIELWVAHRRKQKLYRWPDALCDLGCGVGQQTGVLLYAWVLAAAYSWLFEHARLLTLPKPAQWALAFVGVDFLYYWWHRLSHRVPLLWAAHSVHHQSEDYNLAVALRQSVTTSATLFPFYALLALFGVEPLPLAISTSLSTLYQFWIHTELVPRLPRFEWLFNSPSAHRVHHAVNDPYLDKNHGATLLLWDRLFGTYQPEVAAPVYGTTRPLGSFNSVFAQVAGYLELLGHMRRAPSLWQALQLPFRSYAWHPEWLTAKPPTPQSRVEQAKYDVSASPAAIAYATVWFSTVVAATLALLWWGKSLSMVQLWVAVACVYLTLACIGGTLERRRWVRFVEPARCVAVLVVAALWALEW